VDSAFLIYHDGRLITYYSRNESMKLDATLDMIRRFVKASFSGQLGRLDSMQYENMNIIMERGTQMYMVVITPLAEFAELRRDMKKVLDDVWEKYRVNFKVWDGKFSEVKGVKMMVERFAGEDVSEDEAANPDEGRGRGPTPTTDLPDKPPGKTAAEKPVRPPVQQRKYIEVEHETGEDPPEPDSETPRNGDKEGQRIRMLEDKFLRGEITEASYKELKEKYTIK
jgi:hypothetical protein